MVKAGVLRSPDLATSTCGVLTGSIASSWWESVTASLGQRLMGLGLVMDPRPQLPMWASGKPWHSRPLFAGPWSRQESHSACLTHCGVSTARSHPAPVYTALLDFCTQRRGKSSFLFFLSRFLLGFVTGCYSSPLCICVCARVRACVRVCAQQGSLVVHPIPLR